MHSAWLSETDEFVIIQINLLPEELRKKERIKLSLPEVPVRKALILFFGALFAVQASLSVFALVQKGGVGRVKKEIVELKIQNKEIMLRKADTASAKTHLKEIAGLTTRDFFWTKLVNDLSDSVTKGIWLLQLNLEEIEASAGALSQKAKRGKSHAKIKTLRIDGRAVGQGQETAFIGKFIKELKENASLSEIFQDVKLSNINQKKIREADVYDFSLTCIFRPEKRSS